ncbi:hypothetical protein PRK78_003623 [Emydomyces testavorans]|uniref:Mediator of RNA polymerase II transcription subunit 13 n=1 Tax=Emydomyces testavorans TaxID=2070801 RepID=A0AAF0DGD0_9EURO|nr:hypothetical protein PRK78_003623 [Emydomyces testavorans]
MEFPAGAVTNLQMTDIYSTIHWRIYCVDSHQLPSPGIESIEGPSFALVSELESAILALRDHGCLVDAVPGEEGLWIFSHCGEFDKLEPFSVIENDHSFSVLQIGAVAFRQLHADFTPLGYLIKRLMTEPQNTIFSPLTQQTLVNTKDNCSIGRETVTSSAFYKAFTSAIAGLLTLRATQVHGAIPLGKRTLFTNTIFDGASTKNSITDRPECTTFLSTLNIELSSKALVIYWRTTPQCGLQQLVLGKGVVTISSISLHEDIWLAPTGSLCRYIGPDPIQSNLAHWDSSSRDHSELELSIGGNLVYLREWKRAACIWLRKFGLCSENLDTETWVEVEAFDSITHGFGGPGSHIQKSVLYKRFLWPASLCFKRSNRNAAKGVDHPDSMTLDPLQFAEKWLQDMASKKSPEGPNIVQEPKEADTIQPEVAKMINPEACASLARKINFPELTASAVYPTPPGGVSGVGFAPVTASDGLPIPNTFGFSRPQAQMEPGFADINVSHPRGYHAASASLPGIEITTPAVEIGSGMYDTTADDELFELDGNFGSKEITEADFNFFDEPDLTSFPTEIDISEQGANCIQNAHGASEDGGLCILHKTSNAAEPPTMLAEAQETRVAVKTNQHSPVLSSFSSKGATKLGIISELNHHGAHTPANPSPPLSPAKIKEILFSDSLSSSSTKLFNPRSRITKRNARNDYEPISFTKNLSVSDEKYTMDGKFWFFLDSDNSKFSDDTEAQPSDIPTVGFPEWPVKERRTLPLHIGSGYRLESGTRPSSVSSAESREGDSELGNTFPDYSNPGLRASLSVRDSGQLIKAKDFTSSPLERSTTDTERSNVEPDANMLAFLRVLLFRATDWSLDGYFTMTSTHFPVLLQRGDLIQVAQLVVDQVTQSSFYHGFNNLVAIGNDYQNTLPLISVHKDSWHGEFSTFDLKRYTSIDDDSSAQGLRKDLRYVTVGSISKLDPPHVRINRGKSSLEVLPPAIFFWEPFGLEPMQGQKDIIAYCIHPQSAQEGADAFLDRFGLLYSSANLGQHSRAPDSKGLIPWDSGPLGSRNYAAVMNKLQYTCEHLGDVLSTLPTGSENIVVYIANPFPDEAAIVDVCTAFLCLFRKYISNCDKHVTRLNEVALQIIPLSFIASLTSLVVPPQRDYLHLAFEVYSRCPPKNRSSDLLSCAPPFTLAKSIPRVVPFKLAPDSCSPLSERKSIHVAYSQSLDRRWITAAWTDNLGRDQLTMTYCLREKNSNTSRPVSEIRADIWDVTLHIIGKPHTRWRVMIAKDEPVELDDAEAWVSLAQQHNQNKPNKIELTLLSVNTRPCLYFKIPSPPLQFNALTAPNTSTPVSTPNLTIASPDPSVTAPTPPQTGAEQPPTPIAQPPDGTDSETILIDKSDEAWSVTLSHRLNISPSLTTYHPALASGYLVRRRGETSDTDGLASICVNIIYTHARVPTELLLKEILHMYRDLATLARTKGIIHAQGDDVLPWHISTAVKGREFLSQVL